MRIRIRQVLKLSLIPYVLGISLILLSTFSSTFCQANNSNNAGTEKKGSSNIDKEINLIKEAKSVKLILARPFMESDIPYTESGFIERGCTYRPKGDADTMEILDIIKNSGIKKNKGKTFGSQITQGLYIELSNGKKEKFLFKEHFSNERRVYGELNDEPITAPSEFVTNLYRWASKMAIDPRCNDFVSFYKNSNN